MYKKGVDMGLVDNVLSKLNAVILFLIIFVGCVYYFIVSTYGKIDIAQFWYFVQFNSIEGININFCLVAFLYCVALPILLTYLVLFLLKKLNKDNECFFPPLVFFIYMVGFVLVLDKYFETWFGYKGNCNVFFLWCLFLFVGNLRFNYSKLNVFLLMIFVCFMFCFYFGRNYHEMVELGDFSETDFYEKNFKKVEGKNEKKRNVIIVFAESFNKEYAEFGDIKVKDDEAVKFDSLVEGYAQKWTQGALFSAFTGVHIHYLSSFFRYKVKANKNIRKSYHENEIGQFYKFYTPKINSFGKIAKKNGYQNIFIKGSNINFSGTKDLLLNNGFDEDDIYGKDELLNSIDPSEIVISEFMFKNIVDESIYKIFKKKIIEIDKTKPFLAIMLTCDLHIRYVNDAGEGLDEDVKKAIYNLNDFIEWFKEQDFYKDTTLVVIGDHNRMGKGIKGDDEIYNAFFNLPDNLVENLDTNRTFNQIDMFPTILDIMGSELNDGQAGLGVSLFSNKKTIAEKYSYSEQKVIFSKYDRFYYDLWQNIDGVTDKKGHN